MGFNCQLEERVRPRTAGHGDRGGLLLQARRDDEGHAELGAEHLINEVCRGRAVEGGFDGRPSRSAPESSATPRARMRVMYTPRVGL